MIQETQSKFAELPGRVTSDSPFANEQVRKCGEEIKQLRNQQFLLGSAALTITGLYVSQILPKLLESLSKGNPPPAGVASDTAIATGAALYIVLFVLFWWSIRIRFVIEVISRWLDIVCESTWEKQIYQFSVQGRFSISQTQFIFYIFLVCVCTVFVASAQPLGTWSSLTAMQRGLFFIPPIITVILMYTFRERAKSDSSQRIGQRWRKIVSVRPGEAVASEPVSSVDRQKTLFGLLGGSLLASGVVWMIATFYPNLFLGGTGQWITVIIMLISGAIFSFAALRD